MRTINEKLKYNKGKSGEFPAGYTLGVGMYRNFVKMDNEGKANVHNLIAAARLGSKRGDAFSKGLLSGVRDAANERKRLK